MIMAMTMMMLVDLPLMMATLWMRVMSGGAEDEEADEYGGDDANAGTDQDVVWMRCMM